MDKKFISKVVPLFLENGPKALTMDDIAKEFGMSKKTLYQMYKNKEALLEDVLEFKLYDIIERIKLHESTIDNALERMFCRDEEIENAVETNNSMFIKQLVKYYPSIFHKHMVNFSEKFSEIMVNNIRKGREQQMYREDFNEETYSKLFFQLMVSYESSPFLETENLSREVYKQGAFQMFLNAITTEKGKLTMKKLNEKYNEKQTV